MESNSISLNNRPYPFEKGQTILDVAKYNWTNIPTLDPFTLTAEYKACAVQLEKME